MLKALCTCTYFLEYVEAVEATGILNTELKGCLEGVVKQGPCMCIAKRYVGKCMKG